MNPRVSRDEETLPGRISSGESSCARPERRVVDNKWVAYLKGAGNHSRQVSKRQAHTSDETKDPLDEGDGVIVFGARRQRRRSHQILHRELRASLFRGSVSEPACRVLDQSEAD